MLFQHVTLYKGLALHSTAVMFCGRSVRLTAPGNTQQWPWPHEAPVGKGLSASGCGMSRSQYPSPLLCLSSKQTRLNCCRQTQHVSHSTSNFAQIHWGISVKLTELKHPLTQNHSKLPQSGLPGFGAHQRLRLKTLLYRQVDLCWNRTFPPVFHILCSLF